MIEINSLYLVAKIIISVTLFFVWVVRYENIVKEFKRYNLSDKLRDFVGILKLSFAVMIHSSDQVVVSIATIGLGFLMCAALFMHLKVQNPYPKMVPALSLAALTLVLALSLSSGGDFGILAVR